MSAFKNLWPFLILVIFPLVAFYKVIIAGTTSFYSTMDNADQFYAWYQHFAESIHGGHLPLWDPDTFGGHNFVGEIQTGVFYPLNILWVWLFGSQGGISVYSLDLLVIIHFIIASIGMYLLVKRLGLSISAALVGGLIFAYAGSVLVRANAQVCIFYGLALLPMALYFLAGYYYSQRKTLNLVLSGGVLGMIILAGHIQPYFHGMLIALIFVVTQNHRLFSDKPKAWLISSMRQTVVLTITSLAIALPQLLFSAQYLPNSYRWVHEGFLGLGDKIGFETFAKNFIIEPHELANLINPLRYPISDGNYLFIGLAPLVLVILGIFIWRRQKLAVSRMFVLSLVVGGFLVAVGYHTFLAKVLYYLPVVSQIRELGRYAILIHFGLAILAAVAVHVLAKNHDFSNKQRLAAIGLGMGLVLNGVYYALVDPESFGRNLGVQGVLAGSILIFVVLNTLRRYLPPIIVGVVMATMILNVQMFSSKTGSSSFVSAHYVRGPIVEYLQKQQYGSYRVAIIDEALPVNTGGIHDIQTVGGYGATVYQPYADFFEHNHKNLRIIPNLNSRQADYFNIKYIISKYQQPHKLLMYDDKSKTYLYERNTAYPRVYFESQLGQPGEAVRQQNEQKVSIIRSGNISQKYIIQTESAQKVVMAEVFYPGWKLVINGREGRLEPYGFNNGPKLLKSFDIQPGRHEVELRYIF